MPLKCWTRKKKNQTNYVNCKNIPKRYKKRQLKFKSPADKAKFKANMKRKAPRRYKVRLLKFKSPADKAKFKANRKQKRGKKKKK